MDISLTVITIELFIISGHYDSNKSWKQSKAVFAVFLYFGLYCCNYNGSLKEIHKIWFVVDKMKSGTI